MRKVLRRRPEVEPLESLALLSGGMSAAPAALEALVAKSKIVVPNPLHLSGTVHGTFRQAGQSGTSTFSGSGSLSPLGKVTVSGSLNINTVAQGGQLTLSATQGKLKINFNAPNPGQTFSGSYTISGGTKALAGETGSGTITVTLSTIASRGSFTATFS
jgi:hypothetical protein